MLNSLENLSKTMWNARPHWLPLVLGMTPRIDDLIEEKLRTRDPVKAFERILRSLNNRLLVT